MDSNFYLYLWTLILKGNYERLNNEEIRVRSERDEVVYEGPISVHPILEEMCGYLFKAIDDREFDFLPKEG